MKLSTTIAIGLAAIVNAQAQTNIRTWLDTKITTGIEQKKVAENGLSFEKQKASPSVDDNSGSLVDRSASGDFVNLALNLTGLRPGTNDDRPASGSVTVTAYSLLAAARGKPLTNPEFYKGQRAWRKLSFTLGSEESKADAHGTDKPSTNAGFKYLLADQRDIYSANGDAQSNAITERLGTFATEISRLQQRIQRKIFRALDPRAVLPNGRENDVAYASFLSNFQDGKWAETLQKLQQHPETMEEIENEIAEFAPIQEALTSTIRGAIDALRKGGQFALAFYTKQREDTGLDDYRMELAYDRGLSDSVTWTVNGSFDYRDWKKIGADTRGGRLATEFLLRLTPGGKGLWASGPVLLSGSAEGKGMTGSTPLYRGQAKLVIPILTGLDVPVSYTYANRNDGNITAGSQLKVSLTVDPVRLRERLK